jgi:hypothetical protein
LWWGGGGGGGSVEVWQQSERMRAVYVCVCVRERKSAAVKGRGGGVQRYGRRGSAGEYEALSY